jgi:anaerobic magnesium-protoporphyrin IX monomethyl ester cyclase
VLRVMFIELVNETALGKFPSLGLPYLASSLRRELGANNIEIKIVQKDVEQEMDAFRPDIVGISSTSKEFNRAVTHASAAKQRGLPVIVGGMHISALPSSLTSDMDVGVIGEGERTSVDLARLFIKKGRLDRNELEQIDGIVFRRDGRLVETRRRQLVESLDSLPMPARDLIPIQRSIKAATMFTSRGCPYRCAYCSSSRFWGKLRFFSAEYVVNEIEHLIREYDIEGIRFFDDLFIASKERVRRIVELMEQRRLLGKVMFTMEATSNLIDEEVAQLLKRMNVETVSMGMESGCPSTLSYLKGRHMTVDDHRKAIRILANHGVLAGGSFIIGSPQETRENFMETIRFVRENPLPSGAMLLLLTPFPGTPLWDYAKARGLVNDQMDWEALDLSFDGGKDKAVILSETMTRDEVYDLWLTTSREWFRQQYHPETPSHQLRDEDSDPARDRS